MNLFKTIATKTVSAKISIAAAERVDALAERLGVRKSDIYSVCLLHMPEDEIKTRIEGQIEAINALPKAVRGLLRSIDKLDDAQRKLLIDALSGPGEK
ncbi:hypothetical protein [Sphingomonas sp. ACRSK]|uniref:hypothetical protein n=1 Tax=Sphingomonas sp. ACRSK TaxID=2918213 RepID=UPI001EF47C3F|nr:hypothetical protein [Sphingomonas sp. ACRSK]MCG7349009.1 hypothetical protein [Sphingomonas sp. ACRSK]